MHQREATKDFSPTIPWEEGSLRRLIEIIRLRNLFLFCDILIPDISGWINSIFFLINFKVREGPFHKPSPKWLFLLRFRKSDILHRCLPDPWYWYGRWEDKILEREHLAAGCYFYACSGKSGKSGCSFTSSVIDVLNSLQQNKLYEHIVKGRILRDWGSSFFVDRKSTRLNSSHAT